MWLLYLVGGVIALALVCGVAMLLMYLVSLVFAVLAVPLMAVVEAWRARTRHFPQ